MKKTTNFFKLKESKDVLKQDINKLIRSLTIKKLEEIYLKAVDGDQSNYITLVSKLEEKMYAEYKSQPKEYIKQVAKLQIFLDPKHYIGQFSKMFRIKILQNVYTPDRLLRLDITDMFPEIFLSPKSDTATKLEIYQHINRVINKNTDVLREQYNFILNPTDRRPAKIIPMVPLAVTNKIAHNTMDIKDLCTNPYWKMKKVNIIICKEDNKFYCIDIEKLLLELAQTNTATNYFTKKSLSQEVINNLRMRYATEIDEIKHTGDSVAVGTRNDSEIIDLEQTLKRLKEFQTIFNKKTVLENIKTNGIDSIEDPSVGGVKNILENIPDMIKEEFSEYYEEKEFNAFVEQVNLWLASSIDEISTIINVHNGTYKEKYDDHIDEIDKLFDESYELKAEFPSADTEERLIHGDILQSGRISSKVYNDYVERLKILYKTVSEDLKVTSDLALRSKLHDHLVQINKQLREVRKKGNTIKGIIELLQSSLNSYNGWLEKLSKTNGMSLIYPDESTTSPEQKLKLEQYVKNLQTEIAYLEELCTILSEK